MKPFRGIAVPIDAGFKSLDATFKRISTGSFSPVEARDCQFLGDTCTLVGQ
jgi:hypothetical protein